MKTKQHIFIAILLIFSIFSCKQNKKTSDMNIIFLHHSTGGVIWKGNSSTGVSKFAGRISGRLANVLSSKPQLPALFEEYNKKQNKNYVIKEMLFPKAAPYGWNNYPFDYYNIWVKNAGEKPYMEEPTLEMLTKEYQVIIFKHCFPASNIEADQDSADINSDVKTISNYKLQYLALRNKLHEFPNTKFILFTGAALVKSAVTEDEAKRAKEFFAWVVDEWDMPDDNIYLWDFFNLETEGGLYFKDEYAASANDPHPNEEFAGEAVKLLFSRIIDVIENHGNGTKLTGKVI
jgi:hypothetical protein